MKKLIFLFCITTTLIISCTSHQKETELTEEQKAAIIAEVEEQMDGKFGAANQLDADAYIDYFSSDEFISSNSGVNHFTSLSVWADSVDNWYSMRESRNLNQVESKIILLAPDLALGTRVIYSEDLFKSGELRKSNVVISELWKKGQSGWKTIHFHESGQPLEDEQEPVEE